jgi:hypothetical protein
MGIEKSPRIARMDTKVTAKAHKGVEEKGKEETLLKTFEKLFRLMRLRSEKS